MREPNGTETEEFSVNTNTTNKLNGVSHIYMGMKRRRHGITNAVAAANDGDDYIVE